MSRTVTAIVVNYNAGDLLQKSVDALRTCPVIEKVVVVDNASSDGSVVAVETLTDVEIIKNSKNLGFATACNQGLQRTKTAYVLFLNPDCTFQSGTVQKILETMLADKKVGIAGGMLINPDGSEQPGGRRMMPTPWRSFVRAFGLYSLADRWPKLFFDFYLHNQPLPDHPTEVEAISGACMLVKCEAIEDVGLWDEGYFLHCEDLDWCMRFRQKGWKILFVPDAKIVHDQGACGKSRPVFVEWHKHKGMVRFYRKFFKHQYPGILMWLVAFGVWLRFALVASYYAVRRLNCD